MSKSQRSVYNLMPIDNDTVLCILKYVKRIDLILSVFNTSKFKGTRGGGEAPKSESIWPV